MGSFKAFAIQYRRWLENLARDWNDLTAQGRILETKIRKEEIMRGQLRGDHVKAWFEKVKELEERIRKLPPLQHRSTSIFSDVIRATHSIYKVKTALTKIKSLNKELESIYSKGTKNLQHSSVAQRFDIWVDKKNRLSKLEEQVQNAPFNKVQIIGIHGMGGVGKTALMRKLYIETSKKGTVTSSHESPDNIIEWIDISIDCNVKHVQNKIAAALNLKLPNHGSVQARALCISNALNKKSFTLFLDDVWDSLDLEYIGIPFSNDDENQKKRVLIFTTRDAELCAEMKAQIFEVPYLDREESHELLQHYLPAYYTVPAARLAILDDLCDGLPLAVVALARHAIRNESNSLSVLFEDLNSGDNILLSSGLPSDEAEVRDILGEFRYRFGSLKDEEMSFLLYCSFVDLQNVKLVDIVNQLVGEEDLSQLSTNICTVKKKLHAIIKKMEIISLLQRYHSEDGEHLKMHNFIRAVLSLENHREHLSIKIVNSSPSPNWETARRIKMSLQDAEKLLDTSPLCLNLHSLLIQKHCTTNLLRNIFTCTPALLVLDLSHNKIECLPESIKCLTELQYLNLSFTTLTSLPSELGNLRKLRQLYLTGTSSLVKIPRESFSGLLRLQALDFTDSAFWETGEHDDSPQLKFEDLKCMHYLEEFDITINSRTSLDILTKQDKLCQVTRGIVLGNIEIMDIVGKVLNEMREVKKLSFRTSPGRGEILVSEGQLATLKELSISECDFFAIKHDDQCTVESSLTPFHNLQHLSITNCHELCDISWLRFAPGLKYVYVNSCNGMEKLLCFGDQAGMIECFSNLQFLKLSCMRNLKIICSGSLSLPSLRELTIKGCHHLKEHGLQQDSDETLIIKGDYKWRASMILPRNIRISLSANAGCTPNQEVMAVEEKPKIENICPLKSKDLDYSVRSEIEILSLSKAEYTELSGMKGAAKNHSFVKSVEFIQDPVNQDKSEASKSKSQDKGFLLQSIKDQRNNVWVDQKGRLSKLSRLVNDETIKRDQTIGILGMVGVGKTALMGQLYHNLVKDVEKTQNYVSSNTVTLWIQVSTYPHVIHIQDQIAKLLKLDFGGNDDVQSRASFIFSALSLKNKRILFLDDVTNALDIEGVGIPYRNDDKHQTGSTVLIFTTRYSQVCIAMEAQVYKVPFLDEKESCELFEKHLGTKEELQLKPQQREKLNQECDGLPLAVVLFAEEVKIRSTDILHADKPSFLSFRELYDDSPDAMKDAVAAVKRDFCRLTDEEISCIHYCSLLGDVEVEKCLNMLVGEEGSIPDLPSTFTVAKEKKMATIKKLENLNLLQRYLLSWSIEHMQIHNFIKEVILMNNHSNHVIVNSPDESLFGNWVSATRVKISLHNGEELPNVTPTKNLHSLLMRVDDVVPDCFFGGMQFLRVLDLSHSDIIFLPESVTSLKELQYLNLSNTKIELLPLELVKLKKLRQLYLRSTLSLESVHKDAIVGLARLQVLDFFSSAFSFNKSKLYSSSLDLINLQTMDFLEEFSVTITEVASFGRLLTMDQLCQATMSLALKNINDGDLFLQAFKALSKIKNLTMTLSHPPTINICAGQLVSLEKLSFTSCNISMIVCDANCMKESSMAPFQALWHLTISGCSELQDVSWIRFAPSLKCLRVSGCLGIKELVKHHDNDQGKEQFSKIEFLKLAQNPSLEVIYKGSLSLPSLRELDIDQCPHFKEHLFREKSTDDPKTITGEFPHHWTANADDLLLKNISPSIYHLLNESPTPRPEKASDVAGTSQLTEPGTSKSIDNDIGKSGFDMTEPAGTCQLTEPGTSKSIDSDIGKSGFDLAEPAGTSQLIEHGTSKSIDNDIGKSGFDMTKPCTSPSRDDEGIRFGMESTDNEGKRFRLRWLESPDYEDIGTPLETSGVWVDHKDRLSKLKKLVGDESNNMEQIIGILGMVGVGKTALMRQLYKEMTLTYDISESLVTWIQVSGNPSVIHIQDQMAKALNLDLQNNNDVRARASCIFRALGTKKRCILLLDDVADALDFEGVGIPTRNEDWHEKKRIFIFTTRYSQVCFDMNAQIFEVPLLDMNESYELFKRHLSVSVDGSYEFKDKLQEECHGLPLAVQLLAREAEKSSTNISCDSDLSLTEMYRVNRDALNGALTAIFKPTHGRLTDEDISCLIYYPLVNDMEHEICISALVGKEINPALSSSLSTAKEEMNSRMKKLESMRLLRRPRRLVQEENNKMHNFIKQTIMMGCHPDHVTVTSATECQFESWERARCVRISLPYNIEPGTELPDVSPICSKLHSLFIGSGFTVGVPVGIPSSFFTQMPVLRVLDLSCTDIDILPNSVKYLLELQYLNLSSTSIKSLPEDLGNLKNLRQLYLKLTSSLVNVPRDAFSGLAKLQSLHFFGSRFNFKKSEEYLSQLELTDLENMHHLEEFSATIADESFLRGLLTSSRLREATVSLELKCIKDDGDLVSQALETLSKMKEFFVFNSRVHMIHLSAGKRVSLEKLILWNCYSFSKIDVGDATCSREPPSMAPFHALLHLEIIYCPEVRDISWVQLAPSLRFLTVAECNGIRELVVHNGSAHEIEPWSQLEYFQLIGNENLEIIYSGSLSLPSISEVVIAGSPNLRKHHFQRNSTDSATVVIRIDYWEWTAVPDDLLLPRNIRPTVSYLPDDTCAPIEKATFSEQFQSEGMSSSKPKKPAFWTKLKGMTLVPLRKKHQGMSPSKRKKPAVWRKPFSVAKAMNCCRG